MIEHAFARLADAQCPKCHRMAAVVEKRKTKRMAVSDTGLEMIERTVRRELHCVGHSTVSETVTTEWKP